MRQEEVEIFLPESAVEAQVLLEHLLVDDPRERVTSVDDRTSLLSPAEEPGPEAVACGAARVKADLLPPGREELRSLRERLLVEVRPHGVCRYDHLP